MNRDERMWLVAFLLGLSAISVVVWLQMYRLSPVLFTSRIFFQLILAATLIAMLRNVVGVKAYGVFGPTIITFALLQAGPVWGLVLFVDVFLVALGTRFVLDPLRMGANHRVAVVITTVALSLTLLAVIGEVAHLTVVEASLLLPVLITSWLADEFADDVKEVDWAEPSKRFAGTVALVIASYLLMSWQAAVDVFILTPPLWVVAIGLNIYAARRVHFRLSERLRFRPAAGGEGGPDGVLGMNDRNRDVIARFNPAWAFPGVEKWQMKRTLHGLDIPTPRTFFVVRERGDVDRLDTKLEQLDSFALKPARGHGGEGIIVIERRDGERFVGTGGQTYSKSDLIAHAAAILEGEFSTQHQDVAIVEARVVPHACFEGFYSGGVPDIRVIVLEGVPIMAMTRLPTVESGGAANLHKGAVGVGLRVSDGAPAQAFWQGRGGVIERHPDTGRRFAELKVADWHAVLDVAVRAQAASRLGYAGVDVVIDAAYGPQVLEVNKRPGLAVQNANGDGLSRRINFVSRRMSELETLTPVERLRRAVAFDEQGWRT